MQSSKYFFKQKSKKMDKLSLTFVTKYYLCITFVVVEVLKNRFENQQQT